jgi:hypothetical protein
MADEMEKIIINDSKNDNDDDNHSSRNNIRLMMR